MIKNSVAVWCDYEETRCVRRVAGDTKLQALDFARSNGWHISGATHLCPFHKPKK